MVPPEIPGSGEESRCDLRSSLGSVFILVVGSGVGSGVVVARSAGVSGRRLGRGAAPDAPQRLVCGGYCGHGMPRCFGLARIVAARLLEDLRGEEENKDPAADAAEREQQQQQQQTLTGGNSTVADPRSDAATADRFDVARFFDRATDGAAAREPPPPPTPTPPPKQKKRRTRSHHRHRRRH